MWTCNKQKISSIEHIPDNSYGFIYEIVNLTNGKRYIGKKVLQFKRKKAFGKKKIESLEDKRLKKYEVVIKESDWLTYTGSNKELNEDILKGDKIEKYILCFAENARDLTYLETKYLFINEVLEKDNYYNGNILRKFFKKKKNENK